MSLEPSPATRCARPPAHVPNATEPIAPPIELSAVYRIADLDQIDAIYEGRTAGFFYARDGHPGADRLAAKIAELEGAEAGLVCASGMAAESAVFLAMLDQGDNVALSEGLYGRTVALVGRELARFGITTSIFDATRPETLRGALTPRTRLAFVETLSNPLVRLADLPGLAEVASASGVPLVVDHTFAPLLCRPLELGAEVVIHSATKLISGHSDVTLGLVAGSKARVGRVGQVAATFGMTGNPFDSWLALRGLATLALRSERASANALELTGRLEAHPKVRAVHYPGLRSHPDHDRARVLLPHGFGAMATIDVGGRAEADALIRNLEHIPFAPSLGDVATTLSHPASTSHRGQSPEQWARQGITPGLIRLSFGVEDAADLWADFERALGR